LLAGKKNGQNAHSLSLARLLQILSFSGDEVSLPANIS